MAEPSESNQGIEVHLTTEIFYPELPGGLRQFFRYGPGLRDRGIQLVVHTKPATGEAPRDHVENAIEIREHQLPPGLGHHQERLRLLKLAIAEVRRRRRAAPAKAYCLQPNGIELRSMLTLWRARLSGIPSVFYSTMFPDDPPARPFEAFRYRLRLRVLLSPLSRILVCSHRIAAAYQRLAGASSRRTVVLPNGVDLDRFAPPGAGLGGASGRRALRERLGLPPDKKIVVYVGSIIRRKGVDILVEAWREVAAADPSAHLVLVGEFELRATFRDPGLREDHGSFTKEFEAALSGLADDGAGGSVVMTGNVDNVIDYLRASDVFVFPSLREGLPNAVLEGMACGLPCVVAPFAGIPDDGEEFGDDGTHFVRASHRPEVLAEKLVGTLADTGAREAMGAAARLHVEATQNMGGTLDRFAAAYRGAAGAR